jgi:hypothetical protein
VVLVGGNARVQVTARTRESGPITPIPVPLNVAAAPPAPAPPRITASASPRRVRVGKRPTVTFSLKNPNTATTLTGLGFSLALPRGLAFVSHRPAKGSCHGRATRRRRVLHVASGRLPAGGVCHVRFRLRPTRRGTYRLSSGTVTSSAGGARAASTKITALRRRSTRAG